MDSKMYYCFGLSIRGRCDNNDYYSVNRNNNFMNSDGYESFNCLMNVFLFLLQIL